jgi:hypothetical protein
MQQDQKSLGPSDLDAEFITAIQDQADQEVEKYTAIGIEILSQVPGRVQENLAKFRRDWSQVTLSASGPVSGAGDL